MSDSVVVYAPASIGNVSVGFDVLGAAVSPVDGTLLGDCVEVRLGDRPFDLATKGSFVDKLPSDPKENIVYDCWRVSVWLGRRIARDNCGRNARGEPALLRRQDIHWQRA